MRAVLRMLGLIIPSHAGVPVQAPAEFDEYEVTIEKGGYGWHWEVTPPNQAKTEWYLSRTRGLAGTTEFRRTAARQARKAIRNHRRSGTYKIQIPKR